MEAPDAGGPGCLEGGQLQWRGAGADLVGPSAGTPDGAADGHFLLSVTSAAACAVTAMDLAVFPGGSTPTGRWSTADRSAAFLGVVQEGTLAATAYGQALGTVDGTVSWELAASPASQFHPRDYALLTVHTATGTLTLRAQVTVSSSSGSP